MRNGSSGAGRSGAGASRLRSWLPSRSSFAAAEAVTLGALVTYDVIETRSSSSADVKLPRPAPILATFVFYAMLAAVGSISRAFEPVATAVAWVLALSVLVTGKRGAGILAVLDKITGYVAGVGADNATAAASAN